ncbi:NAD(P)H-quinone oxidoreductase subunit T, chloroplastic-like [Macadamia integrifolia]|uniref:NAD(P)H-quinone oxidoreductase subunit T, chloroplastic-like n=1 Tax=Macadamia integrifolia TaxID=60698 RepID=UPI001C52D3DB|nr:NAD(P)H-quinone oxidoreductase subunit T, chloroplastic-like [Macadamia integrifolia]
MAFSTSPLALSFLLGSLKGGKKLEEAQIRSRSNSSGRRISFRSFASETPSGQSRRAPAGVDTRIHWDNPDEGWIGGPSNSQQPTIEDEQQNLLLGENYSDLLNDYSDSHYQFLGVSADADLEEIKAAYRRLSKEYHPDTTSLPLKKASTKFMKLREVYDTLSGEESRKFYDWTLAKEAASRKAEKMKMKLEDPREQEVRNWESVPDMVDRLGGKNMELSDQAMTALTIDIFIIIFSILCIIVYALFFQSS